MPSISGTPAESAAQAWVADRLSDLGCEVDHWPLDLPALTADPGFPGWEVPRTEAHGVVGTWGGNAASALASGRGSATPRVGGVPPGASGPGLEAAPRSGSAQAGRRLVLCGHVDVVPVGDRAQWRDDPFSAALSDGVVWGRGTCDMKAGVVAALGALAAVQAAGVRLAGSVAIWTVAGEEDGGLGTFAALRRGHHGDAAVIPEPTGLDVVPANAGALTFRLRVPGRSAHASVRREGVDAIEHFWPLWQALRDLETERNRGAGPLFDRWPLPYPLSVGTVRAGDWASSVADELVAEGRLGVALGEPVSSARAALESAVAMACARDPWLRDHPATIEWFGGQFASGGPAADTTIADLVGDLHHERTGRVPARWAGPYGSDLRLLDAAGIPTIQYGPGDVRHAHAPDERVPVDELVTATRVLAATIVRFCGLS